MKTLILIAFSMILSTSAKLSDKQEDKLFWNYLREFGIRMRRSENIEVRKQTFLKNFYAVEQHNSMNFTYQLGINEFSHLNEEELQRQKTGYIHQPFKQSSEVFPDSATNVNTNINWRNVPGVVQPVQNQGSCGSCWAFAGIGALEGQMMLVNNRSQKLSEQEILDCVPERVCDGGWDHHVWQTATRNGGVTASTHNPYVGFTTGRTCNLSHSRSAGSAVTAWRQASGSEEDIMKLLQNGPLFIAYHVSSDFYLYRSGIYQDTKNLCQDKQVNHGVLLTGAGTENGTDFWIMKNSWGSRWGEDGYFRMLRNQKVCGIDYYASYPVVRQI